MSLSPPRSSSLVSPLVAMFVFSDIALHHRTGPGKSNKMGGQTVVGPLPRAKIIQANLLELISSRFPWVSIVPTSSNLSQNHPYAASIASVERSLNA